MPSFWANQENSTPHGMTSFRPLILWIGSSYESLETTVPSQAMKKCQELSPASSSVPKPLTCQMICGVAIEVTSFSKLQATKMRYGSFSMRWFSAGDQSSQRLDVILHTKCHTAAQTVLSFCSHQCTTIVVALLGPPETSADRRWCTGIVIVFDCQSGRWRHNWTDDVLQSLQADLWSWHYSTLLSTVTQGCLHKKAQKDVRCSWLLSLATVLACCSSCWLFPLFQACLMYFECQSLNRLHYQSLVDVSLISDLIRNWAPLAGL